MRSAALALLALVASPALAEPLMTAEEFETFATGNTLDFHNESGIFGTEDYLPGRRVRWAATGDVCKLGQWFPVGDAICFTYEGQSDQHCWTIWQKGDHLEARNLLDGPDRQPRQITLAKAPVACTGPKVGV